MRAFNKTSIEHIYKLTCRDLYLIFNNKYRKKLGSIVVTPSKIFLTPQQLDFLLSLNCRGKVIIGYLKKVNKDKFIFIDRITVTDDYLPIDNLPLCDKCKNIISERLNKLYYTQED